MERIISTEIRSPKEFEDCIKNLRFEDCKFCFYRPKRTNWKTCKLRVRMFLCEGGNII